MAIPASLRVTEAGARVYRRTWRGSVISTFLNPVLFLLAMGVGLGTLVDEGPGGDLGNLEYLSFLAPGLLVAAAMQAGTGDASYPVMAGIKWRRTYEAVLATPVGVRPLVWGHVGWVGLRLVFVTIVYALVMAAFGATTVVEGLLAVPPAVLTGLAFAASVTALTATMKDEKGLSTLFRFVITPLFLFSGVFFPISQLPDLVEWVAYVTPLYHGVALARSLALDLPFEIDPLLSFGYLAAWVVAGTAAAVVQMRRRLVL